MKTNTLVPKINTEELIQFYRSAQAVYDLAPWKSCSDSDLFGVLVNETNELHFVSIMGGAGQCFGIASYRGLAGLDLFLAVLDGLFEVDPTLVQRRQDGLLLEFVDRLSLELADAEMLEQAKYEAPNPSSWVSFHEFSRGWAPWGPSSKDIISMQTIFSALPRFTELQAQDSDWTTKRGRNAFPVFLRSKGSEWNVEWWGDEKIAKISEEIESIGKKESPVAEPSLDIAKRLEKNAAAIWEAYCFYAPTAESTGGRAFFPEICAIMDRKTERCLAMEIIRPVQNRSVVLRDLALKAMASEGYLPAGIVIEETELLKEILILKRALGVEFKINAANIGRQFESQMFENSKVRTFT
jgi:hypothetical protein